MSRSKPRERRRSSALRAVCAVAVLCGSVPLPARAGGQPSDLPGSGAPPHCRCEVARGALSALREEIAAAPTLEEAQQLAVGSTREARKVLQRARRIALLDRGSLDAAHERLVQYETRVAAAATPQAVAAELDAMVGGGSAQPQVDVDVGDVGCNYSTGEVIAVILGLILGVIPGLILLVLLC
jgi:hypothetical protein